jgi:hypothetical protein
VTERRVRLALPLQALSETISVDGHWIENRLTFLVDLATKLGPRFFMTQESGDIMRIEREENITSIPALPRAAQHGILEAMRDGRMHGQLDTLQDRIKVQQRKAERYTRDNAARKELAPTWGPRAHEIDSVLSNMANDSGFWELSFMTHVSKQSRYREAMRAHPRRYASAIMLGAYGALIAFGAMFSEKIREHRHVLKSPRLGDWTDREIASSSAHAHRLLSEDGALRDKVNFISGCFGLRVRATSAESWLGE